MTEAENAIESADAFRILTLENPPKGHAEPALFGGIVEAPAEKYVCPHQTYRGVAWIFAVLFRF